MVPGITKRVIYGLLLSLATIIGSPAQTPARKAFDACRIEGVLSFNVFELAFDALQQHNEIRKRNILCIVDFSKPSTQKRFFVIDLENHKMVFHCLVAHGKNSGNNYATSFSNRPASLQSCRGLLVTAETYHGKHGYSLRLDGLEPGVNHKARDREIVIHGAAYVSEAIAAKQGRLGRSWGCPALPKEIAQKVIDYIKDGCALYIYAAVH